MALTLPSSNEVSFFTDRPDSIQLNSYNGGLTQTTATVTPTRLKNIQEAFLEHSILPPKPFQHEHMAGFVAPSVNISLIVKPTLNLTLNQSATNGTSAALSEKSAAFDYHSLYNSSTNSNDSFSGEYSDEYSSDQTNSSTVDYSSSISFSNQLSVSMNNSYSSLPSSSGRTKKSNTGGSSSKSRKSKATADHVSSTGSSSSQQGKSKKSSGGRKPAKNVKVQLTPEEELKRAKRRERNKLAAARCRKRRLDQTNTLYDKTLDLERTRERLCERAQILLNQISLLKNSIETHESVECRHSQVRLPPDLTVIDFDVIHEALQPLPEDESLADIPLVTTTTNNGDKVKSESHSSSSMSYGIDEQWGGC